MQGPKMVLNMRLIVHGKVKRLVHRTWYPTPVLSIRSRVTVFHVMYLFLGQRHASFWKLSEKTMKNDILSALAQYSIYQLLSIPENP